MLIWNSSKNKPSAHQLFLICCHLTAQLTNEATQKKQLCFFTGEAAECKSGSVIFHTTLRELSGLPLYPDVYIFLRVLSHPLRSAWWISSLSDPLSPLSFSFPMLVSALSLSFMAYSCAATQALAEGLGWGDGRWSVCTFSSKLKYSCMCACVAVWERLHVYTSLVFVYVCVSVNDCGIKNTAACIDDCMSICVLLCASVHVRRCLPGDAWSPVVWFSSQIKTLHINYPWPALHTLTQPTEEEELAEHASLIHHNDMQCTYLKNIHFLNLKTASESFSVEMLKHGNPFCRLSLQD